MGGSESKHEGDSDETGATEQQSLNSTASKAICVAGAVAAGAALLYGLSSVGAGQNDGLSSVGAGQNDEEDHDKSSKFMKAPGKKGEVMERGKFEEDTRTYFRDLRGKKN